MKPKKATYTDHNWHCGCRMYEDGLNMVWDKCNLHAAAPELLEALKSLASFVKRDLGERNIPWCFESVDSVIAKAEGRAQ